MAFLGIGYEERKFYATNPMQEAIRWYTLSARYGFGWAQNRLTQLGQPVPQADLAPQPVDMSGLQGVGEALGSAWRRGR